MPWEMIFYIQLLSVHVLTFGGIKTKGGGGGHGPPGTPPCYGPALDTYRPNPFTLRVKVLNYLLPLRGFLRIMKHN